MLRAPEAVSDDITSGVQMPPRTTAFRLDDEPWVEVVDLSGRPGVVSLREVLAASSELRAIGGEIPIIAFAVLRLMLAVLLGDQRPCRRARLARALAREPPADERHQRLSRSTPRPSRPTRLRHALLPGRRPAYGQRRRDRRCADHRRRRQRRALPDIASRPGLDLHHRGGGRPMARAHPSI